MALSRTEKLLQRWETVGGKTYFELYEITMSNSEISYFYKGNNSSVNFGHVTLEQALLMFEQIKSKTTKKLILKSQARS